MTTANSSRIVRMIARVKQIWSELDYAQRRLLEVTTGVTGLTRSEHSSLRQRIDQLELQFLEESEIRSEPAAREVSSP